MKYCRTVFLLFLLPFFCVILTSPFLRSMFFLSAWEQLQDMETFRNGNVLPIRVQIPGGWNTLEDDWFPLVSTFRADELFQEWSEEEGIELTILYNFPSFSTASNQDSGGCCSHLFDPASGYYNSFYGAYIVRRADGSPYGFTLPESKDTDAKSSDIKVSDALPIINMKEAALLPYFDYQMLVFRGFGLSTDDFRFEWTVNDLNAPVSYLGIGGWTRIQAELTVSGASHCAVNDFRPYLPYGTPNDTAQPFSVTQMYGCLYGRYFPELQVTLFLYAVASDPDCVRRCDQYLLSRSRIS